MTAARERACEEIVEQAARLFVLSENLCRRAACSTIISQAQERALRIVAVKIKLVLRKRDSARS